MGDEPADVFATGGASSSRCATPGSTRFRTSSSGVEPIAEVRAQHASLTAGEETEARHRVAGRIAARRGQGGMAFLDLVDRSGRIQLQARLDDLGPEGMERLLELDLGDVIGVDGVAFATRRGELTLRIERFELLAKSLRPLPEKRHGLKDVETRFRHRELDLIANEEVRDLFVTRARVIAAIRRFLDAEGFVEVETPVLQPLYGGAAARPVHHAPQRARPHAVPADRDRAVPQAADRRRPRARLRDRQGLPQRGRRFDPQPRVHDARVVRGVRGLRGRSPTAASGSWRTSPTRSATTGHSTSRRRGAARRWPARSSPAPGSTSSRRASATRWSPRWSRAG